MPYFQFWFHVTNVELHRLKNIHEFLTGHAEVAYGIADDKLRDWLHMGLEHDGTPQARLHPYLMSASSAQRLQAQLQQ